jgi:hypothetical protein
MKILYFFLAIEMISTGMNPGVKSEKDGEIRIEWTDQINGDFSFKYQWSYPEGVFVNDYGQVSCDGDCPSEIDGMKDSSGRILKDSLTKFYRLVDTTHLFHSIRCDAWCYEWGGTDFITVRKINKQNIDCYTHTTVGTHCSLKLKITKNRCIPVIELNSIKPSGRILYPCKNGQIKIDPVLWAKGIMKAEFTFTFVHKENPQKPMYWKGNIYAGIEE